MLREGLPEMLWSITNLDGDRFHELPVQKVVGGAIHPLLAYERLPIHILVPQDALDVALGITKLKRDVAQTQMAIGQITTQDASDVDDNGGVLCAGLGSNGHKNAVADRSATLDTERFRHHARTPALVPRVLALPWCRRPPPPVRHLCDSARSRAQP
jgi:hypothetical protein